MSLKSKYLATKKKEGSSVGQRFLRSERRGSQKWGLPTLEGKFFWSAGAAIVVGLILGGALLGVYKLLAVSEFFQIASVKIEGNRRLDAPYIQALSGVTYRANLLALDVTSIKRKIVVHPWIAGVDVERNLPSEIVITIRERIPVALVNGSAGLFFLDKKGIVYAPAIYPEQLDFPVITGLENEVDAFMVGDIAPWRNKVEQLTKILAFFRHAGRGSSALPRQNISEMHLTKEGGYQLFLADRPFPIYLGKDVSRKRYSRIAKVLYWLYKKKEFPDVNFIRMDYMNNKVLVGKKNEG